MQAKLLIERLRQAGYPASYAWTGGRAYVSRPLIWAVKRLLKAPKLGRKPAASTSAASDTPSNYRSYLSSTQRLFKRPWLRKIWTHISLAEHMAEILVVVLPKLMRGQIVVCDRYIYDSLIGIGVLSGASPVDLPRLLRLPPLYRVPKPDAWFFIDLPAQVAFDRRTDVVDVEFLERRIPLYQTAATTLGMSVVDGTGTPEEIAAQIWQRVEPLLRQTHGAAGRAGTPSTKV